MYKGSLKQIVINLIQRKAPMPYKSRSLLGFFFDLISIIIILIFTEDFIERWGTHYIKSAKFGGQLEIRKTMDKETAQSKTHFSITMEAEFKSLFASVGASFSAETGSQAKSATETTSTSVVAQGGSHEIASILSDVYSPTFKTEFKHWLTSIPSYPKPFKFRMGPIADLVNFRAADLFPDETVNWGCEGYVTALKSERNEDGELVKYYEITEGDEVKKKVYCPFDSRGGLEQAIRRRRSSLHRAIEVYMEEVYLNSLLASVVNCLFFL